MRRYAISLSRLAATGLGRVPPPTTRRWIHRSAAVYNDSDDHLPRAPLRQQQQPHPQQQQRGPGHVEVDLPVNIPGPGMTGPAPNTGGAVGAGVGSPMPFPSGAPSDAALTTVVGLGIVFLAGVGYVYWYKRHVLAKIEQAFSAGYDPALELASFGSNHGAEEIEHLRRKEQDLIDKIIAGKVVGHYFVLLGSKGTGKGSMIIDAMRLVDAEGVAMLDAHPDIEVVRQRIGKAINFEYYEDSQTGLFQRRDPREAGPALDIERALNKLEKVALRYAKKKKRPLVLIFNNIHLIGNSEEGRNMVLQLQQRAETWAESGVCTCVFTTDDSWIYLTMKRTANRAQFITVEDLSPHEAFSALQRLRKTKTKVGEVLHHELDAYHDALQYTGGRLSLINKVARAHDMHGAARDLLDIEKGWLRSRIGLIDACDDDVMDEEFVKLRQEQVLEYKKKVLSGEVSEVEAKVAILPLPTIPYWRVREIMTRADFIEDLDTMNVIAIDTHYNVRPDSMLILRAASEVVNEEGFQELIDSVRQRIDDIESLHRTTELTLKKKGSAGSMWFGWPFI